MKKNYQYYTPEQSTQFTFYNIPQALFLKEEFSILSTNAKLLYGLLLDRLNLSVKNGWIDKDNHAYISMKITTISKMVECSEKKCSQLLTQLEEIGLIKRIPQGFGRPSLLYVMNFIEKENAMTTDRKYDYFSLEESQQFNFYRVPKVLFTDAKYFLLSTDAKILYGLLLDRMSLSFKYKWVDNENHTYIYFKAEEAENLLRCSKRKVSSLFSELKKAGLIQQQKQGLNRPTRIYVMNFVSNISLTKIINKNIPQVKAYRKLKSGSITQNLLSGQANFIDTDVQNLPIGHANSTAMDVQILPIGHANFTDRDMQNLPIGHANSTAMDTQNLPIGHGKFYR